MENKAPKYCVLLEGARRVGKFTIAEEFSKQGYKSYIKVDFASISEDVGSVFDEIQLVPKVGQTIKYLVAGGRYDYIETGSLISIKKNVKDIVIPSEEMKIQVYPMDFEEFMWATGNDTYSVLRELYRLADRSARMNPAGSQISLHQCSNLHKFVLTCGAIYSKRLVGRFQALTSLGSGRTFLQCVMPVRMTLVLQYQNLLLPLYKYHDFL